MNIDKTTGNKKEVWSVVPTGLGWYETYGPSMTDLASFYKIEDLLKVETESEIAHFERILPREIKTLKKLMELIITEIENQQKTNSINTDLNDSKNQLLQIKSFIKKLNTLG
ncbi:MAG: hypothetical protein AB8F74_13755 [Saprospiraceae bacterium]